MMRAIKKQIANFKDLPFPIQVDYFDPDTDSISNLYNGKPILYVSMTITRDAFPLLQRNFTSCICIYLPNDFPFSAGTGDISYSKS